MIDIFIEGRNQITRQMRYMFLVWKSCLSWQGRFRKAISKWKEAGHEKDIHLRLPASGFIDSSNTYAESLKVYDAR